MYRRGLRNRNGNKVTRNGFSHLLNNPFYIGLIHQKRTGELFSGSHQPLISKTVFDRVQAILTDKTNTQGHTHTFPFRRLFACRYCGYSLIGETQKGHTYYLCHTKSCPTICVREEAIEGVLLEQFSLLQINEEEEAYIRDKLGELKQEWAQQKGNHQDSLTLSLAQLRDRLTRLTDAYIDREIDKNMFEDRKTSLIMERKRLEEALDELKNGGSLPHRLEEFLELVGNAYFLYQSAPFHDQKRRLVERTTSNRRIDEKNIAIALHLPFREIANRSKKSNGSNRWTSSEHLNGLKLFRILSP